MLLIRQPAAEGGQETLADVVCLHKDLAVTCVADGEVFMKLIINYVA